MRGGDLSSRARLISGVTAVSAVADMQGQLASVARIAAGAGDWETRAIGTASSQAAANSYGYREFAESISGSPSQTVLDQLAASRLAEKSAPHTAISLEVIDAAPARFSDYGVGDIVGVELFTESPEWAITGKARILARDYSPETGRCKLEAVPWP
jgi:hypothetical protein